MNKAETTRQTILQNAFGLVYKKGYQATSVDDIIATLQVTKGAFFYHFKNKDEMGLAMIKEVMHPGMHNVMVKPLLGTKDPIAEIYTMMKQLLFNHTLFDVKYGCPAVNLIEEMSPINPVFNAELAKLTAQWQDAIEGALKKGQELQKVNPAIKPKQSAAFIVASYGGIRNLGKLQGTKCYTAFLKEFKNYLTSLR